MAINKVVYGNNTLIDLTEDSVLANNLLEGETAHDKSGNPVTGTAKQGHIVQNSSGTDMTQRAKMQFPDSFVSDDETNGRTIVENIKEHTTASDYENATEDGIHVIDDGNDVPIGEIGVDYVEVTGDGVKTYGQLLNEIMSNADTTKISERSVIVYNGVVFQASKIRSNEYVFTMSIISSQKMSMSTFFLIANRSVYRTYANDVYNDSTNDVVTSGRTITLYYGTSSTVINLKTDANYCQYDSQTTVKQAIDNNVYYEDVTVTTDSNGYADIRTKAPIDKTISVNVISPKRNSAYLWVNADNDTEFFAYVYGRGASPSATANTSVTLRLWKRR